MTNPTDCDILGLNSMHKLSSRDRLSAATSLLVAGYTLEQVAEQVNCSDDELKLLQELLDARLIMPQPTTYYKGDHVDVVKEFEELIPVFKGQVHVAILAATVGAPSKGGAVPDLLKDYAGMLMNLSKLYQVSGIGLQPEIVEVEGPTLKSLLSGDANDNDPTDN